MMSEPPEIEIKGASGKAFVGEVGDCKSVTTRDTIASNRAIAATPVTAADFTDC